MSDADHRSKRRGLERILALVALVVIGASWYVGMSRAETDLKPFLSQAMPNADNFTLLRGETYAAWRKSVKLELIGYVAVGEAHGYGGNLRLAVAVSQTGDITGVSLVDHKETGYFIGRVLKTGILDELGKKRYSDPLTLGRDVDVVTGATATTRALTEAVRKASRKVAVETLGLEHIPEPAIPVSFGVPEAVLILLMMLAVYSYTSKTPHRKKIRWASWITSLVVIGFVYSLPLTLAIINKLLLGFWPAWQLNLYWYILIAGSLGFLIIHNRNTYCERICPFGAAQECFGAIGWAKGRKLGKWRRVLLWAQRVLALACVVIALLYYNPSNTSYEVFSAFFQLIGSSFTFGLLALSIMGSFFIKRPWCNYLCPIRPVMDYLKLLRNWTTELLFRSKPARDG